MADRILRRHEVQRLVGVGSTKLYELIREGRFPPPVRLTGRTVGWRESEVQAWIDSLPTTSEGGGGK